jgi:hypothetical protein
MFSLPFFKEGHGILSQGKKRRSMTARPGREGWRLMGDRFFGVPKRLAIILIPSTIAVGIIGRMVYVSGNTIPPPPPQHAAVTGWNPPLLRHGDEEGGCRVGKKRRIPAF